MLLECGYFGYKMSRLCPVVRLYGSTTHIVIGAYFTLRHTISETRFLVLIGTLHAFEAQPRHPMNLWEISVQPIL